MDIVVKLREAPVRGDDEDATTATHGRRLVREGEGRMGIRVPGAMRRGRRSYRPGGRLGGLPDGRHGDGRCRGRHQRGHALP